MKNKIGISIIIVTHLVGAVGLCFSQFKSLFISLTPLHLLTSLTLFFVFTKFDLRIFKLFFSLFFIGFTIEVIGVKTGVLFGEYKYGSTLGIKVFETPLMIGVNWFLLAVISHGIFRNFIKNSTYVVVCSAFLMVLLDVIIEPVAINLDFWSWQGGIIPIKNYLMWFIVSIIMQIIIAGNKSKFNPIICWSIFIGQLLFFVIQNIYLGVF
jgi:putative membrane protein